jgi:hypothetical protein
MIQQRSIRKLVNVSFSIFLIIVSLIPAIRLIWVVFTAGMNNPSNDYVTFAPTVIRFLHNGIHINDLGSTCFRNQCEPLTFVIMTLIAKFFAWNVLIEMLFSIIVTLISIFLIYFLFAGFTFSKNKVWLLIFISAIAFSFTQIASFTFGQASIYPATTLFGLTLSLLGYKFYPKSYKGLAMLIAGMLIAAWSYGAGLIVIPLAFVALLIRFRRKLFVGLWFISLLVTSIPYWEYFQYLKSGGIPETLPFTLLNYKYVIRLLGLFFSNGTGISPTGIVQLFKTHPTIFGLAGITVFLVCIILFFGRYRFNFILDYFPHICLALFGLGSVWQISIVRSTIGPWYIIDGAPFWIGLCGIAFAILNMPWVEKHYLHFLKNWAVIAYFCVIASLWLNSNLSYEDKTFHILSRAPASVSCLQYYQTAPTYCEGTVFQWGIGNGNAIGQFAAQLDQNHLSVFGPQQVKTLQGEYIFEDRVKINAPYTEISWWTGLDGKPSRWNDYKHLDLLLPAPDSISWSVDLPEQLVSAKLVTAIGINGRFPVTDTGTSKAVTFTISIRSGTKEQVLFEKTILPQPHGWTPVNLSLTPYAGQHITLKFKTSGAEDETGNWTMYQFPHIDLQVNFSHPTQSLPIRYVPDNTELANEPIADQITRSVNLNPDPTLLIGTNAIQFKINPSAWKIGVNPAFQLLLPRNVCLPAFSDFTISLAVAPEVTPRYLSVVFYLDNGKSISLDIPLLSDGGVHTYTYPLRLIEFNAGDRIVSAKLTLANPNPGPYLVQFGKIELINDDMPTAWPYTCGYPMAGITPKTMTSTIVAGDHISQSFISDCKGAIDQVGFVIGTYGRENTTPIVIQIQNVNGHPLDTVQFPTTNSTDNIWQSFKIPPLANTYHQPLMLIVTAPQSTQKNGFALAYNTEDVYPDGYMTINDHPLSADLVFRYTCTLP